jgi:hypothetical protein
VFNDGFTPWRRIAVNFDAVVFNAIPNAHGDAAYATTPWARYNELRGVDGFGVPSYFGRAFPLDPNAYEAITAAGALLGGTLAGVDYSKKLVPPAIKPINLVRLVKKWFASDTGADVFLDSVRSRGGYAWWYDIFPNILACQLSDVYDGKADAPGDVTLSDLCGRAIHRWYQAADYLRDGFDVPEFAFKAVQLVAGPVAGAPDLTATPFQPIAACDTGAKNYLVLHIMRLPDPRQICFGYPKYNGDTYESDSSAGLAYLGLYGYEKFGDRSDRRLADWGLTFLDRINYDPLYENMLAYGAYASARMNAEYGTKHDTVKMLNGLFSVSTVRRYYGMIGRTWGTAPAYGVVGARKGGYGGTKAVGPDYAFAMDTMQFAATIAPIPRYDETTAAAIGKYLSHVAHNARFFYPAYLRYMDPTTQAYIASSGNSLMTLSLPFEGAKSKYPGQVDNEPFGTGDALKANRKGAYTTDLGIYSGIFSGAMAKLFNPTAVANIYQVDILATDIPKTAAFPTYLFYNPYDVSKNVPFRVGLVRGDARLKTGDLLLYDTVNKQIVARDVTTSATVTIRPHEAVVIVAVPQSEGLEIADSKVRTKISHVVVDYNWLPKPADGP